MSKHTLTKRQQLRIKKQQQQRSERATANINKQSSSENDKQEAVIVAQYRQHVEVCDITGKIYRCHLRKNLGALAVGDHVVWQLTADEEGVVVAIKPRHSELYRFHKLHGNKLVATNVDQLFMVTAPEPPRALNVIDRYLMLAEIQHIEPIIIYNKVDLLDAEDLHTVNDYLSYYETLGYKVIYTSANDSQGLPELLTTLYNKTSIFVGLSGVGKSSLVNTILPEAILETGELSDKSREGNHTTTTAKLCNLPQGGQLIDCPGIRELAIGDVTPTEVLQGFKELAELAAHCRFRNCHHTQEAECAILIAENVGTVNLERLASYRSILEQLSSV